MKILVDTREKIPWTFASTQSEVEKRKLDTGDYTLEGLEDVLCIERKKSVAELAGNVTDGRFTKELLRISSFKYAFLILEFDYRHIDMFPEGSDIPKYLKKKVRVKGNFIIKRLSNIAIDYGIHILPCTNTQYAEHVAYSLMKRVYERV